MNQISRLISRSFLALATLGAGLASPAAFADRVVNFYATGADTFLDNLVDIPAQGLNPECVITIYNAGPTNQNITVSFTSSKNNAGAGTVYYNTGLSGGDVSFGTLSGTPTTAVSNSQANVASGSTVIYTWKPGALVAGVSDTLICQGTIQVTDSSSTSPGFITASGYLMTFVESSGGKWIGGNGSHNADSSQKGIMNPTQNAIVIGEGRPF